MLEDLGRDVTEVLAFLDQAIDHGENRPRVSHRDGVGKLVLDLATRRSEKQGDDAFADLASAEYGRLVEERERVTEGTLSLAGERQGGGLVERDPLFLRNAHEVIGHHVVSPATEVEPLAPSDDRGGPPVGPRGGEDEPHARRRVLA